MDIANSIRSYVIENLLFNDESLIFNNDSAFLEEGIIDSTGVMELVLYVEQEFGIDVPDRDITPEHFNSVNKLAQYILSKTVPVADK